MYLHLADLHSAEYLITWCVGKMQIAWHKYVGMRIFLVLIDPIIDCVGTWQDRVWLISAGLGQIKVMLIEVGGLHGVGVSVPIAGIVEYIRL
jgi:hypothetical protein